MKDCTCTTCVQDSNLSEERQQVFKCVNMKGLFNCTSLYIVVVARDIAPKKARHVEHVAMKKVVTVLWHSHLKQNSVIKRVVLLLIQLQ